MYYLCNTFNTKLMAIFYKLISSSLSLILIILCCFNNPVLATLEPSTSDIFNIGLDNIRQENYKQALINFTQVINRQDDLAGAAYSNRCLSDLQLKNYIGAEADCNNAIENNSNNIEAYLNLGLAYYYQEKYDRAIAEYQEIIQRNTKDRRPYYNLGLAYFTLNEYQNAIADYKIALKLSADSKIAKSQIYNELALSYMMLSQDKKAILNFSNAISSNKNNSNAYFNRGCAYNRQEKYEQAIKDFNQVIALQPNFTQAYVHRAILQHKLGQKETAFKDLKIALKQYQIQGNSQQYKLIYNLQYKLFYAQVNQIV